MSTDKQLRYNFPIFYHWFIYEHTAIRQYDIINILLVGDYSENCLELYVSQAAASNYISGRRMISKEFISKLFSLRKEDVKSRLKKLHIQNLNETLYAFETHKNLFVNINNHTLTSLQDIRESSNDPYDALTELFLLSLRTSCTHEPTIDKNTKEFIKALTDESITNTVSNTSTKHATFDIPQEKVEHITPTPFAEQSITLFEEYFMKLNVKRHKLTFPDDYHFLSKYLHFYGTNVIRPLSAEEILTCMNTCENNSNSYIVEIYGSCWESLISAIHLMSYKSSINVVCMADVHKSCSLVTLRNVLLDIYDYISYNAKLAFSLRYTNTEDANSYILRFIISERITDENRHRNNTIHSKKPAKFSPDSERKNLVPPFFTDYPEERYSTMPLGPEYDPELDETEELLAYMEHLLTIDRSK